MEWLPIETAPKDGTRILACNPDDSLFNESRCLIVFWGAPNEWLQPWSGVWFYNTPAWHNETGSDLGYQEVEPTYWMPLPEPPK